MKMSKKDKKKKSKEALKYIITNKAILGKFREVFGMYDYDDDDVKDVVKACIKSFKKNNSVDPDEREWDNYFKSVNSNKRKNKDKDADEDDEIDNYIPKNTKHPTVVRKDEKKEALDSLLGSYSK